MCSYICLSVCERVSEPLYSFSANNPRRSSAKALTVFCVLSQTQPSVLINWKFDQYFPKQLTRLCKLLDHVTPQHLFVLFRNIQNSSGVFPPRPAWNADSHSRKQEAISLSLPISGHHSCLTSPPSIPSPPPSPPPPGPAPSSIPHASVSPPACTIRLISTLYESSTQQS